MLSFRWFSVRAELLGGVNILLTAIFVVYLKESQFLSISGAVLLIWISLQITNIFILFGRFLSNLRMCFSALKSVENYSITPQEVTIFIISKFSLYKSFLIFSFIYRKNYCLVKKSHTHQNFG